MKVAVICALWSKFSKNNPLRTIYDSLNIKNINQYGKINTDIINTILKEKFPIKEEFINKFTNFFSSLNTLFDLNKLADFIQSYSNKSQILIPQIIEKIKGTLIQDEQSNLNSFVSKFNLKLYEPYSLIDLCMMFPPIFKISLYGINFI